MDGAGNDRSVEYPNTDWWDVILRMELFKTIIYLQPEVMSHLTFLLPLRKK
jgi:hypothetical protein